MATKKQLIKREFDLDAQVRRLSNFIKKYASDPSEVTQKRVAIAEIEFKKVKAEFRTVQRSLYGWRHVISIYGDDEGNFKPKDEIDRLRLEITNLETSLAEAKGVLRNYPTERKAAEDKLAELRGHLQSSIGYRPSKEEVEEAQEVLLLIDRRAGESEILIPELEGKLKEAQQALAKAEKERKISLSDEGPVFADVGNEIISKVKKYMAEHAEASYTDAIKAIFDQDPFLAQAYVNNY